MSPSEQLNRTEVQVATVVWQGHTNPEIAAVFGTSEQVIKNHLRTIFDKLGLELAGTGALRRCARRSFMGRAGRNLKRRCR